jgi:hypothetical protein
MIANRLGLGEVLSADLLGQFANYVQQRSDIKVEKDQGRRKWLISSECQTDHYLY